MEEGRIEKSAACFRFESELEAYLEGESRPFITAHAQECPFCRVLQSDLEEIRQAARELPLEEPLPAVWANLHARLEATGAFRTHVSFWRGLLAWRYLPRPVPAGVLAGLAVLGSVLTMPPAGPQHWETADMISSSPAAVPASVVPGSEDSDLARLVGELENDFRANNASLAPDLKATYEKSLVSLDDAIRECRASLREEPGNTLAHDYLLTAYTRKAEMLSFALESQGR
jgi:hypothetical protein